MCGRSCRSTFASEIPVIQNLSVLYSARQRTCVSTGSQERLPQTSSPETARHAWTDTEATVPVALRLHRKAKPWPQGLLHCNLYGSLCPRAGESHLGPFPLVRRGGHKCYLPLPPSTGGPQILCAKSPAPGFSGNGNYCLHGFYHNLCPRVWLAAKSRQRLTPVLFRVRCFPVIS